MPESSSTHAGSVNVCTRSSTFHRSPSPAAAFTAVLASTYAASATQAVRTNTVRKNAKKRSSAMRRSAPQSAPSPAAAGGAVLGDIGRLRNEVIVRSGVEPPDRPQPMPAPQRIASNDPNVREVSGERPILQPIALDSKCVEIARRHTAHQVTRVPLALRRQSREKGITEAEEVDHVHLGPDGKTENAVGSPLDDALVARQHFAAVLRPRMRQAGPFPADAHQPGEWILHTAFIADPIAIEELLPQPAVGGEDGAMRRSRHHQRERNRKRRERWRHG